MSKCSLFWAGLGLFLSGLLLQCCGQPTALPPVEYVQWVKHPDHGLLQTKTLREYIFIAQYKPLDFIVAQEERTSELSKTTLKERKKALGEEHLYFNFRVKSVEGQLSPVGSSAYSKQEYQHRLGYFTFDMQRDLYLLHGQDTFPCTLFQFVRSYDVAPYIDFALGFKKPPQTVIDQNITFVFDDQILGIGTTRLLFEHTVFNHLPAIKTS